MNAEKIFVLPATTKLGEILHIEGEVQLEPFVFSELTFTPKSPLEYVLDVIPANQGVAVVGELNASLNTTCVRCLEDAKVEISTPFNEEYYFEEKFDNEGEPFPRIDEEGYIDISDEIIETLLVGIPFAPLCCEDCQGLCVKCGASLKDQDCGCADEVDESHPFAKLVSLIPDEES